MEIFKEFPYYKQQGWDAAQIGPIPYLPLTVIFAVVVFLFERYLDLRQLSRFRSAKSVPKELEGTIPDDTFNKSLAYGKDKFEFGLVESTLTFVEGIVLVLLGYLPWAWDFAARQASRFHLLSAQSSPLYQEMVITSIFVALLILHDTIVSIPFSLYGTFVVEERHGFNKSTLGLFLRDKLMTLALTVGIGSPILAMVVWLVRLGGPHFYFYVWAFLFIVSILLMTLYPTLIAPLFNKYTKLEDGPIYDAIADLAKQVNFPLTKIFLVDGSKRSAHSNAYFYGFFKSKRIVLFDTLITQVELPELLAILGHEIGHWKLWHTAQGFLISQSYIFALFLTFSFVQNTPGMFEAFGFHYPSDAVGNHSGSSSGGIGGVGLTGLVTGNDSSMVMPVFVGLVLFAQTFWTPVDKVLTFLVNCNSRRNEFAADAFSASLKMGEPLARGLIKISIENLGNMVPDPWYSTYHFSHPPLVERLRALPSSATAKPPTEAVKGSKFSEEAESKKSK